MNLSDCFLLCFAVGTLWSVASLVLGGFHLGHSHAGHAAAGSAHVGHGHLGPGHVGHASMGHAHVGHAHAPQGSPGHSLVSGQQVSWMTSLVHPSSFAAFLTWFGGAGYILTRHTGWLFWTNVLVALLAGCVGAWILASFLRFLQSKDQPLNPADYQMVGVLGRVSCPIRPGGVGEVIFLRDGARRPVPARSEDGCAIGRSEEVIITRYEDGIASVRTWAAMVPQSPASGPVREALQKESKYGE